MKHVALILLLIAAAGCATMGHLNTPSGRPEITLHASLADAQKASLEWLLANGFTVGNPSNTSEVIFLAGEQSLDNGNTSIWIRFNYFPKDSATTKIYASKTIWWRYHGQTRPQTSQEDFEELQSDLEAIAQDVATFK